VARVLALEQDLALALVLVNSQEVAVVDQRLLKNMMERKVETENANRSGTIMTSHVVLNIKLTVHMAKLQFSVVTVRCMYSRLLALSFEPTPLFNVLFFAVTSHCMCISPALSEL
jgi:hypothetical protein